MRGRVELKVVDPERGRPPLGLSARKGADPGAQLGHRERLDQVVVGAAVESGDAILELVERGQHQDRDGEAALPDPCADREPVQPREDDVEDQQVVRVGLHPGDGLQAVLGDIDGVAARRRAVRTAAEIVGSSSTTRTRRTDAPFRSWRARTRAASGPIVAPSACGVRGPVARVA